MSSNISRNQREALRLINAGVNPLGRFINNPSGYAMLERMRVAGLVQGWPVVLTDKGRAIVETAEQKKRDRETRRASSQLADRSRLQRRRT